MSTALVDAAGTRVEVRRIDGADRYVVTDRHGYLLHGDRLRVPDPRTPADLAALGVDLATLAEPDTAPACPDCLDTTGECRPGCP